MQRGNPSFVWQCYQVFNACHIFDEPKACGLKDAGSTPYYYSKFRVGEFIIGTKGYGDTDYLYTELYYCRTGFNSDGLTAKTIVTRNESLSLEFAIEVTPIIPYIGVVFPFMGLLSLNCYHFYFLMILKETLTFLSLSYPVPQYH